MTEPKRLLLIINPISGTHDKHELDHAVRAYLSQYGYVVDTFWTTGPGTATYKAREASDRGYYGVIVAGGDGTLNEVACGLRGSQTTMGIIPCGSGNGLARHLGMGIDFRTALGVIAEGYIADVDYGSVNDRPFLCTCGVGFDAAVSERFAAAPRRGRLSYIKSTLQEFVKYKPDEYVISLPGGQVITEKAFLVAVCNASQYGNNAYIAPGASIRDGMLDVTIVHSGSPLSTAIVGVDLLTGFISHNMLIDTLRTPALSITRSEPGPIHADGDPVEAPALLEIKCHAGALRLFAPPRELQFKPIITPMQSLLSDVSNDLRNLLKRKT